MNQIKLENFSVCSSSDEEDNHKENIDPHLHSAREECPPKGDPVKAFVDEEAEEEDDSDNDLHRFSENEDEDIEDSEELKDIIATNYEERPMDNERRNELHRKWLEQQDADGTENLLKKLKFNSKHRESTLLDDEQVDSECEEFNDDAGEEAQPKNPVQVNKRKAKQIITQMFIDKDDVFLSDDEEETEKRRVKQHVLVRAVSPILLGSAYSTLFLYSRKSLWSFISKLHAQQISYALHN